MLDELETITKDIFSMSKEVLFFIKYSLLITNRPEDIITKRPIKDQKSKKSLNK